MYKIKLVLENSKVGDIRGNLDLAKSHIAQAVSEKIDLVVFSEMFLTGYPPEDLLLREDFLSKSEKLALELEELSKEISVIIGCPAKEDGYIFNSALFFQQGKFCLLYTSDAADE